MSSYAHNRVLVGVDAVAERPAAVDAAVREAQRLGVGLSIVHVFEQPVIFGMQPWAYGFEAATEQATSLLEAMTDGVRAAHPGLDVRCTMISGAPAYVLIEASHQARLIVLGCRGQGGFSELLLGSVSSQVAAHAHCPVLILRPADRDPGTGTEPVLVGVDGSPASNAAVGFAFAEADNRGVGLVALHVWAPGSSLSFTEEYTQAEMETDETSAALMVAEAIAGWSEMYPDVKVERRVVLDGFPEEVFIKASETASMVVVGSRGRGGFTGLMLGSVSQALLHHGHCPVAVVRP